MGRPEKLRTISCRAQGRAFKPVGRPAAELEVETLRIDELEALRLADLEGLYQEAAAERMGVSRPTFARILDRARSAVARALIEERLSGCWSWARVRLLWVPANRCRARSMAAEGDAAVGAAVTTLNTQEGDTEDDDRSSDSRGKIQQPLRRRRVREGKFSSHFGGAETFALYIVDKDRREISEQCLAAPPEHGRGVFPMWLRNQGVTTILAGGMGPRASNILAGHGIDVVLGADGEDPETMVRAYLDGTLSASGELCHEHGFHDCGNHKDSNGCGGHRHNT